MQACISSLQTEKEGWSWCQLQPAHVYIVASGNQIFQVGTARVISLSVVHTVGGCMLACGCCSLWWQQPAGVQQSMPFASELEAHCV